MYQKPYMKLQPLRTEILLLKDLSLGCLITVPPNNSTTQSNFQKLITVPPLAMIPKIEINVIEQ